MNSLSNFSSHKSEWYRLHCHNTRNQAKGKLDSLSQENRQNEVL